MTDDSLLKRMARQALQSERLPNVSPVRMLAGNGFGVACDICRQLIEADQVGYALQFESGTDSGQVEERHAHLMCFLAWELERKLPQA